MRRYPAPADRPSQAKLVEYFGVVVGDSSAEDLALPGIGWSLEALHLLKDLERPAFPQKLRGGCDVLPPQEPAHVFGRGDGSYLLAQSTQREAMDACK